MPQYISTASYRRGTSQSKPETPPDSVSDAVPLPQRTMGGYSTWIRATLRWYDDVRNNLPWTKPGILFPDLIQITKKILPFFRLCLLSLTKFTCLPFYIHTPISSRWINLDNKTSIIKEGPPWSLHLHCDWQSRVSLPLTRTKRTPRHPNLGLPGSQTRRKLQLTPCQELHCHPW